MKEKIPCFLFGTKRGGNEPAFETIIQAVDKAEGEVLNKLMLHHWGRVRKGNLTGSYTIPKAELEAMVRAKFAIGEISFATLDDKIRLGYCSEILQIPTLVLRDKAFPERKNALGDLLNHHCQHKDYESLDDLAKKVTKFMKGLKNG